MGVIIVDKDAMSSIPRFCHECPLHYEYSFEKYLCRLNNYAPVPILKRPDNCPLREVPDQKPTVQTNIYDEEEIHHNCTVQILRNSVTGEVSVGWFPEEGGTP